MAQVIVGAGTAIIPEAEATIPPTPVEKIDELLSELHANADRWVAIGIQGRIDMLDALIASTESAAQGWVDAACKAKSITPGTPQVGEEWLAGPNPLVRNYRLLRNSLKDILAHGKPKLPGQIRSVGNNQVAAPVFPTDGIDKLMLAGFTAEVWMEPGMSASDVVEAQASIYANKPDSGKVALVLGAGNVASIGPMDALYKLFVEDQVVIIKTNPVNEYLGPFWEACMQPLVSGGFLRVVYGGAEQGKYLTGHDLVDEIHITGSDKTHDIIIFGPGAEGAKRKAAKEPVCTKRITSELGNVSPVIVVPGEWSDADIRFHAENLASMLTNNAGFNCNATRVIITHKDWPQRTQLLDALQKVFREAAPRNAYYPGSQERYDAFTEAHPEAIKLGDVVEGSLPWVLIANLDADKPEDICFTTEAWCSITSEVAVDGKDVADFVKNAVLFANDTTWGTLNSSIIAHPKTMKDPIAGPAVEQAIADLRTGCVVLNHWAGLGYGFVSTTWGAFPGHDLYDIQSGVGVVHNTYLLEGVQKTVIRGPFRVNPTPPWFVTNKRTHELAPKLFKMEASPSLLKLPSILWSAARG